MRKTLFSALLVLFTLVMTTAVYAAADRFTLEERMAMGDDYLMRGRADLALQEYNAALAINPACTMAHNNRSVIFSLYGMFDKALEAADKAVAAEPKNFLAYMNRGNALTGLGRHKEALAAYDKAVGLYPGAAAAHLFRANALLNLGRYEEACKSADKAVSLWPDNPMGCYIKGVGLCCQGKDREAVLALSDSAKMDPTFPDVFNRLAEVMDHMGRKDDAKAFRDKAKQAESACVKESGTLM